ncbi:MAG: HD domain-containing protein [Anaeromyxobacteraceae bacterium]
MDKIWVKDVKEGERPKSVFLVARKAIQTAKSGKTYLAATFQDKTGELEARAFEKVEELAALFEEKDLVEVEGIVGTFQGKPQLRIETIAKLADPASVDAAEFVWVPPPEVKKPEKPAPAEHEDGPWKELLALVEPIVDPHVKALVQSFVEDDDIAARLRRWPAAKSVHHAYPGGLLEHTVACLKLAHRLADQYPQVDRDLLVAGAFFHDLGKIRELGSERSPEYSDEGRLVGHHVMTAQWIHDRARRLGVPRELEHQLVHLVLAHHGKLEYGSPKVPMTLEALLTHEIDEIDSRVNSWLNLMGKEGGHRRWTSSDNVYEQPIWRGALPTVQAEKKGPPAEVMTPVIYVPRDGQHGGGGGGQNAQKRKEQRPPKPKREPRPPRAEGEKAAPAGEAGAAPVAKPAEGGAPAAEARPERRPHGGPPDRGGPRGPGGFGDKKRGYQGPRLPGDKGPHRPPEKPRNLTHNPFAALAAKLEDPSKATEAPAAAEPAPEPPAASEPAPAAEAPAGEKPAE